MLPGRRLWEFVGSDYFIPFFPFPLFVSILEVGWFVGFMWIGWENPCLFGFGVDDGWMDGLVNSLVSLCLSALLITSNYLLRTVHGLAPIDLGILTMQ